jgi:hypothetical protein
VNGNSSVTLRQAYSLRVFKKGLLRRVLGPKYEKIRGGCGKLHIEELHNLYSSVNKIRVIRSRSRKWLWHEFGKSEGKSSFG